MPASVIRFPVTCPECGEEQLCAMPTTAVEAQLVTGERIRFYALCHHSGWDASPSEVEQLRGYLSAMKAVDPGGANVVVARRLL